jgi:hypothetical protein
MVLALRLSDPEYWRSRAAEARAEAAKMQGPAARRMLLGVAENYDQLAEQQQKLRPKAPVV